MIPTFTRSQLRQDVLDNIKGNPDATGTTIIDRLINRAVRDVLGEVDTRSTKRKFQLSVSHADDLVYDDADTHYDAPESIAVAQQSNRYEFHCPTDLKAKKIVDIVKRTNRQTTAEYRLTSQEEFDRRKTVDGYLVALSDNSLERRLLVSGISTITTKTVSSVDGITDDGTWSAFGGASSVATTDDAVEGDGAVSFNSDLGSATAGIVNSTITAVDVDAYDGHSIYVWVYIPEASDITNFILRLGSSSANYKTFTATRTHDLLAFYQGWNLLRFDWDDDVTDTGTPDMTAVDYVAFYMTKDTGKAAATGWIVDAIIAAKDSGHDVVYYSKYGWMASDGTFKETADDDADFLVADTDEYRLFVDRCSEYASRRLGNDKDEQKHFVNCERKKAQYKIEYPSEAMVETESYHFLGSTESRLQSVVADDDTTT